MPTQTKAVKLAAAGTLVRRVVAVGLATNALLATAKLVCGILGSSSALVADAVDSYEDLVKGGVVFVGSYFWSAPPDEDHPYGHRRIETIIALAIAFSLVAVAFGLGADALSTLRAGQFEPPNLIAAVAALASILGKQVLSLYTMNASRRLGSSALAASALDYRSDVWISLLVLVAVTVAHFVPAWSFLDPLASAVVVAFILKAAWTIGKESLGELIDKGASAKVREKVLKEACSVPGVRGAHDLRSRYMGGQLCVDLHLEIDPDTPLICAHRIGNQVRDTLLASGLQISDVLVHLDPFNDSKAEGN
jgi:cation diffusion facilitator family transporter